MTLYEFACLVAAFLVGRYFGKREGKSNKSVSSDTSFSASSDVVKTVDRDEPPDSAIAVIKNLRIDYEDGAGEFTSRDITTHYYDPDGGYIRARCHLRNADRTFRIDRISEAIDAESGEIVTRKLRSWLRRHKL